MPVSALRFPESTRRQTRKIPKNFKNTYQQTRNNGLSTLTSGFSDKRTMDCGSSFCFAYYELVCNCCFAGRTLLTFGEQNYVIACQQTTRWYEHDFIITFVSLLAHVSHRKHNQLIHCVHERSEISEEECRPLQQEITTVVSALYAQQHFAVCVFDIGLLTVFIFDGLRNKLTRWQNHVVNILKRCDLIERDYQPTWKMKKPDSNVIF